MNPIAFINDFIGILRMPEIGLSQVLDITILAGLLYYILKWIRQTRAWALLKGIAIVVLVALVAFFFELETVMWMMQNALTMGLIALVILFQPELRKALEQIGRGVDLSGLTDHKSKGMQSYGIEELIAAVIIMSERKTGALICIERDVTLSDISESGLSVDALITRQLIMNIFTDRSPLHDGAMIVHNDRIVAATCILPLTNADVDHELGTRHRAAIGLSETSDAVVIVVSEETGSISIAMNGKLNRHLTEVTLRETLNAEALEETKRRLVLWKNRKER